MIPFRTISQQTFSYATTAQLSCHVQNLCYDRYVKLWKRTKRSTDLNCNEKKCEMGPWFIFIWNILWNGWHGSLAHISWDILYVIAVTIFPVHNKWIMSYCSVFVSSLVHPVSQLSVNGFFCGCQVLFLNTSVKKALVGYVWKNIISTDLPMWCRAHAVIKMSNSSVEVRTRHLTWISLITGHIFR